MEIEQLAIRDYLSQCAPLAGLPGKCLNELTMAIEIEYARRDKEIYRIGDTNHDLRLIRRGAVEVTQADGSLYGRFSDGEWVGHRSLLNPDKKVTLNVKAIEDTLFYVLPDEIFSTLLHEYEQIRTFFTDHKPERLRSAIQEINKSDYSLLSTRIVDLMRPPLLVPGTETIRATAIRMTDANRKTALITQEDGRLCGIVTDQDFRSRVVAKACDMQDAVSSIMTQSPLTLPPTEHASEALLLMTRRNIRHIPIVDAQGIHGVLSATDLLREQSQHAVYLVADIHQAEDVATLARLSATLPQAMVRMVRNGLPAYDIGHAISSIGQAIMRRLIKLAEAEFGPPPIPYAFIVAGSMARREQTAHTDQDAGMILSDDFVPERHDAYFLKVGTFVSDGMHACGYVYCPGNIMASNTQWRQPLRVWREYFRHWIEQPDPQALLNASIFFDLRWIDGDASLLDSLRQETLQKTRDQSLFQAFMAGNALAHQPPLGFFRGFILEKQGSGEKGMDMKIRGVVPVIDLARVYSLAKGIPALNTRERLQALRGTGALSDGALDDLLDAFEFISVVRLQHQAAQIESGQPPDNYVAPDSLSALERRHLKDAFEVVSNLQDVMAKHYRAGQFR